MNLISELARAVFAGGAFIGCYAAVAGTRAVLRGRRAARDFDTFAFTTQQVEEWVTGPLREAATSWAAVNAWGGLTAAQLTAKLADQYLGAV